jgi:hypothetical protein
MLACGPIILWIFWGEDYLARTRRVPANVLVVEGWIGSAGARAAAEEFLRGGYAYVVAVGGMTGEPWETYRYDTAQVAARALREGGVPAPSILVVSTGDVASHRTFASSQAAANTLVERHIEPTGINVFTRSVHARRSRLIFSKGLRPLNTPVGVVAWFPPGHHETRWWQRSYRVKDLIEETAAYPFELLFSSGR